MTEDQFIELVHRAEQLADKNINQYKLRLALFAMLGYLVIFGVLLILAGMTGGLVALALTSSALLLLLVKKKIIFILLFMMWIMLRALWVRFDKPEGYELKRNKYPELFDELDNLRNQLDSLKIHQVLLQDDLNAAVVQHARLGILGWHKNILILGLPLMLLLSPDEMRSVLAHELGHLSGNHSRFNAWIYRIRKSWTNILHALEETNTWGAGMMRWFFDWYSPRFSAYSFALARNNEYEADAIAAELTSPDIAGKALVNVHAMAPYIEKHYWENFFNQADHYLIPQHAPYDGLANFLASKNDTTEQILERIKEAMSVKSHYGDTHPSLKDRFTALGAAPSLPAQANPNNDK